MRNKSLVQFLAVSSLTLAAANTMAAPQWAEGRILVKPTPGLSDTKLSQILNRAGGKSQGRIRGLDVHLVKVPAKAEDKVAAALANNPNIEFAEKDMLVSAEEIVPNDPLWTDSNFWHLQKIEAPQAWDYSTGDGVIIAICDSGVDAAHPDLAGKLVSGWNTVSNNNDITPVTVHGTRVAGVAAAASDNAEGVASAAWDAMIMPMRVSNRSDGQAYTSDIAECITWAVDHGAQIVNASFASLYRSGLVTDAGAYARSLGTLTFVSAGNSNTDDGAAANPELIVVSATNSDDSKASFSNYGQFVDIAAPGNTIWTTSTTTDTYGMYQMVSGTSFSAPMAAGIAALIMAADPNLSPAQVEAVLKDSSEDLGAAGFDAIYGYGRLNAGRAVLSALGVTPDTTAPSVTITNPSANSQVAGTVSVNIAANDDTEVTSVELYANGDFIGIDNSAPYSFNLDTTQFANGALQLQAMAFDASQNNNSYSQTVNVDNAQSDTLAPSVSISNPASGSTIRGVISVSVTASDNKAVALVKLYANNILIGSDYSAPYSFSLNTANYSNGSLTLRAVAIDTSKNSKEYSHTVTVKNRGADNTAPTVRFTNPLDGAMTLSGRNESIQITAHDNQAVSTIKLYIDGSLAAIVIDHTSLSYTWQTRKVSNGVHTLKAVATDRSGNQAETIATVYINDAIDGKGGGKGKNK